MSTRGDGAAVEAGDIARGFGETAISQKFIRSKQITGRRGIAPSVAGRRAEPPAISGRVQQPDIVVGQQPVTPPVIGKRIARKVTARKIASANYVGGKKDEVAN